MRFWRNTIGRMLRHNWGWGHLIILADYAIIEFDLWEILESSHSLTDIFRARRTQNTACWHTQIHWWQTCADVLQQPLPIDWYDSIRIYIIRLEERREGQWRHHAVRFSRKFSRGVKCHVIHKLREQRVPIYLQYTDWITGFTAQLCHEQLLALYLSVDSSLRHLLFQLYIYSWHERTMTCHPNR